MNTFQDALAEYVTVRRAFGTQFREPAVTLGHFVAFLESEKAQFITTPPFWASSLNTSSLSATTASRRETTGWPHCTPSFSMWR
jgi:hypothetical protein